MVMYHVLRGNAELGMPSPFSRMDFNVVVDVGRDGMNLVGCFHCYREGRNYASMYGPLR